MTPPPDVSERAREVAAGDRVVVSPHPSWTSYYAKLAGSGRIGIVERVFTPLGAHEPTCRVVFPKEGRRKELVEYLRPADLLLEADNPAHP